MSVEHKVKMLIEEAQEKIKTWRDDVKRDPNKFHTPPGLFKEATSEQIAQVVSQDGKAEYKTVISRLNFYLNRGGRNIPQDIRIKVEKAKDIVRLKYDKPAKK